MATSTRIDTHPQYHSAGISSSSELSPSPTTQFNEWFQSALADPAVHEPEAMALSTVSSSGIPSTRIVLCKRVDERGWVFFTNYTSRKGRELFPSGHEGEGVKGGYASLAFYWPQQHKQIRVVGRVEKLEAVETKEYYDSRPVGSRIGAWASPQSQVLRSREELEGLVEKVEQRFGGKGDASMVDVGPSTSSAADSATLPSYTASKDDAATSTTSNTGEIPVPPFWGGVRLVPFEVEFWMGRESRLHDRFRYTREEGSKEGSGGGWKVERLAP